jgi:hypothetical protein
VDETTRQALERARRRLDRIGLYPRPVGTSHVRVHVMPWLFGLPWFRRFDGYAAHGTILLRRPLRPDDEDLLTHELCHVWQMQHRPLAMPLSYLVKGYAANPYEAEARRAVEETRRRPRVLVFLHGTAIMHASAVDVARAERVEQVRRGEPSVAAFAEYVPTPGTVERLRAWANDGAELLYLSSHGDAADVAADEAVLRRHAFPQGPILFRGEGETYAAVAARAAPDVLLEDDCESIGGADEMTAPQLPPALRARVQSIVVPEFGGLTELPADVASLLG